MVAMRRRGMAGERGQARMSSPGQSGNTHNNINGLAKRQPKMDTRCGWRGRGKARAVTRDRSGGGEGEENFYTPLQQTAYIPEPSARGADASSLY